MLLALALFATQTLAQEALVPAQPRVPLPRPSASAARATPNQNRVPAGARRGRALSLTLEVVESAWRPEGPDDPEVPILALREPGKTPQVPSPLVRAPLGTEVTLTLRNGVDSALVLTGMRPGAGFSPDTLHLAARATREVTYRLDSAGTYLYWGSFPGVDRDSRLWYDSQLGGAIVVDAPSAPPVERVFVISEWFHPYRDRVFEVALVVNGKAWPHSERITLTEGDSARWAVLNASTVPHPMHLHGFYYRVTSKGGDGIDTRVLPAEQVLSNTDVLHPGRTMSLAFLPTTPGNWVFHCHFAVHVGHEVSLVGSPRDSAEMLARSSAAPVVASAHGAHGAVLPASAARYGPHEMRGLVLGVHVLPRPGRKAYAPKEPPREIRLFAQRRENRIIGGQTAYGFVVQGDSLLPRADSVVLPGPVLELERGKPVRIVVRNRLHEPTGVHWHGLEIESFPDGVPNWSGTPGRIMPPIAPGDSFVAEFTPPRAGTFLYHSHLHELGQIGAGMYGALLVLDKPRDRDRDHVIIAGGGGPPVHHKIESPYALVNGRRYPRPIRMVAGETNRIRLVSIHPEWIVSFTLTSDSAVARWRALAKDGADLPPALATERLARLEMGPGETADFEFTPPTPGTWRMDVRSVDPGWHIQVPVVVEAKR